MPPDHPERVARIETVDELLARPPHDAIARADAPAATDAQILRAHSPTYLAKLVESTPTEGWASLDPDTHMSPASLTTARHAAGANIAAVEAVLSGEVRAAFCATRPPGHHAERERAMGFCLLSNLAIGALHALEELGLERVAIVDFDVHHGNGTQNIFQADPRVMVGSTHQMPLYPGTGRAEETGVGNIVNVPLAPLTGGAEMRAAMTDRILPALRAHAPQLVMIGAGFDAHHADPLANLNWTGADFRWATERICEAAAECCEGRVVSALEGGYDLGGLAEGLSAHLGALNAHARQWSA